ncbi:MAG: glycosyltransferase family 2 protein, partial [Candidatus Hydrogenedentes bacterium]|nr:glycosyltransferase family 2 protein [Candidatus Hydrogenedentota bacterium]
MARTKSKTLSLVVPCFNEADVLPEFLARVRNVAQGLRGWQCEFLFVDDGSQDATPDLLTQEAAKDPRVRVIRLSRNFGHQRAISAGTDFCTGDAIVITDADLQDPPELIPDILRKLEEGHDIVHMVRSDRRVDGLLKRTMAHVFYRAMRRWVLPELPENAGDFKGFNRHVLVVLRAHRERVRFMRGAFATMGFRQTQLRYVRAARHAGQSKYPLRSTLRLARDAVFSNSALPMRPGIYAGAFTLAASCLTAAGVSLYAATGGAVA